MSLKFRLATSALIATSLIAIIPSAAFATRAKSHAVTTTKVIVSSFSEKSDPIDHGVSHVYSSAWAHVSASSTGVYLARAAGAVSFAFTPVAGRPLTVGEYDNLQRAPLASAGFAGMNVTGPGAPAGCVRVTGSFHVWDVAANATGKLTRLDLTYAEHCNALAPTNFGEVLINDAPRVGTLSGSATRITFPDQTPVLPYVLTNSSASPEHVSLGQVGNVVTHFWMLPVVPACKTLVPAHAACHYTLALVPPKPGPYAATIVIGAGGATMHLGLTGSAP